MLKGYGEFDIEKILQELEFDYKDRGVVLVKSDNKFYFRTSPDLGSFLNYSNKKNKEPLQCCSRNFSYYFISSTCHQSRDRKN